MTRELKIIEKVIEGDFDIAVNMQINHLRAETVVVHKNITARLYGTISKLLVLKKGSSVMLHGSVSGEIQNEGGELTIFDKTE